MADDFADRFISVAASKEELVRLLFLTFPEIPKNRAALELRVGAAFRPRVPESHLLPKADVGVSRCDRQVHLGT